MIPFIEKRLFKVESGIQQTVMDKKGSQRVVAVMMIGAFIGVLNQTLLATILPEIMHDFQISSNTVQWLTTIFMLVNGIMIPVTAFLIERFTLRQLFFTATGFVVVGSFLCFIGPNFSILLVGRAVQALDAGMLMPLTQTLLFIIFPPEKRGLAMGMFGLVIGFAPAIGPTASGWFVNFFDWRYLFLIVLLIAVADFIFGYVTLQNMTQLTHPNFDVISVIETTLGFGGLLYGFSVAGQLGWTHPVVYVTLILSIVILILFVLRQLRLETPLLEFRVFKYRNFTISMMLIILMFMLFIGSMTILPIFMQNTLHWSPLLSGLILLPGGLVMGLLSPVMGKVFDKMGGRSLSILGMSIILIGALLLAQIHVSTPILYIIFSFSVMMLGNAMIMTPMTTAALNALPMKYIAHGTAMNNTMRQISAAIGTGLLVTAMTSLAQGTSRSGTASVVFGLNMTYYIVALVALIGVGLAFFVKNEVPSTK